ncbi:SH3 domain-containing protein [Methylobacterium sp. BTF04]|uniref:SH3 domain-containing protein n=1 Tax=Methylobacterium sp. BTF04 TaxID=2708300 RepID=UPI0013D5DCF5|nr:SH3 domain-containing protein [Methylobacterium sp. BTF04]NEU13949.1 SH3 domain-containing protein [Methylobacterium sp. BTF04]
MLFRIAVACALAAILTASPARAAEAFRVNGLPRGETLSIRDTPEAGAAALGQVPEGARIRGFGCTSDTPSGLTWCRVKSGPIVGWARRRYLAPE